MKEKEIQRIDTKKKQSQCKEWGTEKMLLKTKIYK